MDRPFVNDNISEIHEADTLYDSHLTSFNEVEHEQKFHDQKKFTKSILNHWGISVGNLSFNRDNEMTLRCIAELIEFRQKQLVFKDKIKDDISALTFEKEKYRSFMEQGKATIQEYSKRIGKLQNENIELKAKLKRLEAIAKKEKDQDKKMINMFRNKNQQILHQIKKKQQEVNKIKQQMKKSVGQKSMISAKNNFEIYQNIQSQMMTRKSASQKVGQQKYFFLMQKNQRQLNLAVKENKILRQKLFEIRDQLIKFNMWIDGQIFGQNIQQNLENRRKYNNKFYINHNLLFKKQSLKDEFVQLLQVTKDGLLQLRSFYKESQPAKRTNKKSEYHISSAQQITQTTFKKKYQPKNEKINDNKTKNYDLYSSKQKQKRDQKIKANREDNIKQQNITPPSIKQLPINQMIVRQKNSLKHCERNGPIDKKVGKIQTFNNASSQKNIKSQRNMKNVNIGVVSQQEICFSEDFLDDEDNISITSHISVQNLGKQKFDKWDILFREENS